MTDPNTTAETQEDDPVAAYGYAGRRAGDYVQLLKPRVMSLVVFTALVGMIVAPVTDPNPFLPFYGVTALICIAMGAGASGALNMWYDRDIDAIMQRTRGRPLPRGAVEPDDALAWGLMLSVMSVAAMAIVVNWVAAALLALTIFYYVVIYTAWLKRRTPQNIVIGGAAGSFPPMIGWAAMTGRVDLESIVLFLIIFMWTPPHFWALSLYRAGDYEKAGVPMLPVVAGEAETRLQILIYTVLLVPLTLLPSLMGFAGWAYTAAAVILGLAFFVLALGIWWGGRMARDDKRKQTGIKHQARRLFAFSIFYLFGLFFILGAEHLFGASMLPDRLGLPALGDLFMGFGG